jgi:hypothetical protein
MDRLPLERLVPALRRLTGLDFGWREDADPQTRRNALRRWRGWIDQLSLGDLEP